MLRSHLAKAKSESNVCQMESNIYVGSFAPSESESDFAKMGYKAILAKAKAISHSLLRSLSLGVNKPLQ